MKLLLCLLLIIVSVVNSQSSCPEPEQAGCLVCGEGKCISDEKADAVFSFEGFGEGSCADIQAFGLIGTGENADLACQYLPLMPSFQTTCGCVCRDDSCKTPQSPQRTKNPRPTLVPMAGDPAARTSGAFKAGSEIAMVLMATVIAVFH
mmetsp:Transcript_31757/g.48005  ORF Transcript_31757/g.48005 Transcript_31757/m.48005 type:complete len:149 (+) Transcript_31757:62-508(+)